MCLPSQQGKGTGRFIIDQIDKSYESKKAQQPYN